MQLLSDLVYPLGHVQYCATVLTQLLSDLVYPLGHVQYCATFSLRQVVSDLVYPLGHVQYCATFSLRQVVSDLVYPLGHVQYCATVVCLVHLVPFCVYPVEHLHDVVSAAYVSLDPIPTIVSKATIISIDPIEVPNIPHVFFEFFITSLSPSIIFFYN